MHHVCVIPKQDAVTMKAHLALSIEIISSINKSLHIEKNTERALPGITFLK